MFGLVGERGLECFLQNWNPELIFEEKASKGAELGMGSSSRGNCMALKRECGVALEQQVTHFLKGESGRWGSGVREEGGQSLNQQGMSKQI